MYLPHIAHGQVCSTGTGLPCWKKEISLGNFSDPTSSFNALISLFKATASLYVQFNEGIE
jgi:hypothetical protein